MLPIEWVDKLFQKLVLIYGVDVAKRYAGLDPAAVKKEWATTLGPFTNRPEAIKFALDHLPSDRPPSMLQFRDLCRQCPPPDNPALTAPKASKEVVNKEMAKLVAEVFKPKDPLLWARKLKARHDKGEPLSAIQVKYYKQALGELR